MTLEEAMKYVVEDLKNMSSDEFRAEIEKHKDDEVAQLLLRAWEGSTVIDRNKRNWECGCIECKDCYEFNQDVYSRERHLKSWRDQVLNILSKLKIALDRDEGDFTHGELNSIFNKESVEYLISYTYEGKDSL